MITIDYNGFFSFIGDLSASCDLALAARLILSVSPLYTGFLIALRLFAGKKIRVGFGFPLAYLTVSSVYFLFAAADAYNHNLWFRSIEAAATVSAALFAAQFFVYLCLTVATKFEEKPKKRFVARVSESPIPRSNELFLRAYPLKSNKKSVESVANVDYEEFLKFIDKIGDKELSFSDREEYNKIKNESRFLSGVDVTADTAQDFCSLFMRSVKLAARYGVE